MPDTDNQQQTDTSGADQAQGDTQQSSDQNADTKPVERELADLRAALKKANKEAEQSRLRLKEVEDRDLSEMEKAQRRAEKAEKDLADLQSATLRQRVALEKGLPAHLVPRLQGSTEEELSADADELLELVKAPTSPKPDPSQGARGGDPKTSTADQFAAAIQGEFST